MSVDVDHKTWNSAAPCEINGTNGTNHDDASWPGSSGVPSPSEVNDLGSESLQEAATPENPTTPQVNEDEPDFETDAKVSDAENDSENVDTNQDNETNEAAKTNDTDDDMDCFSFNFSIKKSFFTRDKTNDSAKHQEVLLMDKMMKQCFGYIILSRTTPNGNGDSSEFNGIENHLKRNTFSPCESYSSGPDPESNVPTPKAEPMSDFPDSNINGSAVSYCKTAELAKFQRNKRKRVRPQQRDDVLAPSPVPEFPAISFGDSGLKQEYTAWMNSDVLNLSSASQVGISILIGFYY